MEELTLAAVAARVKILEGQVSELFGKMNDTRETQSAIVAKLDNVLVTIGEIKQAVGTLSTCVGDIRLEPAKKWDGLSKALLTALITGMVALATGYILAKIK